MARITKIPCEGAIYTVHSDDYGFVTETDLDAGAQAPPGSDEAINDERARYAQVLRELSKFEETIAQAEERHALTDYLEDSDPENGVKRGLLS
jgi:hypothetical protein